MKKLVEKIDPSAGFRKKSKKNENLKFLKRTTILVTRKYLKLPQAYA